MNNPTETNSMYGISDEDIELEDECEFYEQEEAALNGDPMNLPGGYWGVDLAGDDTPASLPKPKSCTCGVSSTHGKDIPDSWHSDWCDLRN